MSQIENMERQLQNTADPLKKQFIKLQIEREKRKVGTSDDDKVLHEAKKYADMANTHGFGIAGNKEEFKGVDPYRLSR